MLLRHLLLFLLIFYCNILIAAEVKTEVARKIAVNFFCKNSNTAKSEVSVLSEHADYYKSKPLYYVLNLKSGGWVIVAGDDRIIPVIGYSPDGFFDVGNIPCCLKFYMKKVIRQIEDVIDNNYPQNEHILSKWQSILNNEQKSDEKTVSPLILSIWGQGKYYNAQCPLATGGPDGRALVGCVATAMSQVMYYYRYPLQGSGSHGGVNFGTTTYRWNEMLNELYEYNFGVAQLCYHAGVSVDMDYGASASGSYTFDVPNSLLNYFNYSIDIAYESRDMYWGDWIYYLVTNLDDKHPVIYSGHDDEGGHAWICDGYQGTDYFHMIWGWSGYCDGYFYLDNLAVSGYDFTDWQSAVFNIYPPYSSFPYYCSSTTSVPYTHGTIEDGSGPENYLNNSDCRWLIEPPGLIDHIIVSFNKMSTENTNDVLKFYDGSSTSDPLLGTFSGTSTSGSVQSTGDNLLVQFVTNGNTVSQGWQIEYNSFAPVYCSGVTYLTEASGTITDGSESNEYFSDQLCRWSIRPPNVSSITVKFNSMNLGSGDFLKIYNENTGELLETYTGSALPAEQIYYISKVFLHFQTDEQYNAQGWALDYTSTPYGVSENTSENNLNVYPNPAKEKIFVDFYSQSAEDVVIQLFAIDGKLVYEKVFKCKSTSNHYEIDARGFASGVYFLSATSNDIADKRKVFIE